MTILLPGINMRSNLTLLMHSVDVYSIYPSSSSLRMQFYQSICDHLKDRQSNLSDAYLSCSGTTKTLPTSHKIVGIVENKIRFPKLIILLETVEPGPEKPWSFPICAGNYHVNNTLCINDREEWGYFWG
jgi:hypothetical protein